MVTQNNITNLRAEIENFCDYRLNIFNGHIGIINSLIDFMANNPDEAIEISINNTSVEIVLEKNND